MMIIIIFTTLREAQRTRDYYSEKCTERERERGKGNGGAPAGFEPESTRTSMRQSIALTTRPLPVCLHGSASGVVLEGRLSWFVFGDNLLVCRPRADGASSDGSKPRRECSTSSLPLGSVVLCSKGTVLLHKRRKFRCD